MLNVDQNQEWGTVKGKLIGDYMYKIKIKSYL